MSTVLPWGLLKHYFCFLYACDNSVLKRLIMQMWYLKYLCFFVLVSEFLQQSKCMHFMLRKGFASFLPSEK